MANEKRVRVNNVFGALGTALTNSGTTIDFGATAPGFPTIDSTKHAAIILDPDTVNEEIVYLTAYTAGALTGTILRAQEGTTGVAHGANAAWVHGPTKRDNATGRVAFSRLTAGPYTIGVAWTDVSTSNDCVLPAQAGDVVEVTVAAGVNPSASGAMWIDVVSIVSAAAVNSWGLDAAAPTGTSQSGAAGLTADAQTTYFGVSGTLTRVLTAADISGGTVTLRMRAFVNASTRQIFGTTIRPTVMTAKNLGPQEAI